MKEFLSKSTLEILEKYEDAQPIETINDIDICAIDKGDLEFLLGYTMASLNIERELKEKVNELEKENERLRTKNNRLIKEYGIEVVLDSENGGINAPVMTTKIETCEECGIEIDKGKHYGVNGDLYYCHDCINTDY